VTTAPNPKMKRKHWIIAGLTVALLLLVCARVFQARSYMQQQIERLARKGYPGYEIYACNYLGFSDYRSIPCITVKAKRKEDSKGSYGDGYHYIEVDFPWIPFTPTMHRI
jgi:hypothetical protein